MASREAIHGPLLSAVGRGSLSLAAWFPRGFLCPWPSHPPGSYGTAHSAATGKYREPALLRADGGFWRHTVGVRPFTLLASCWRMLYKKILGRSTLGIPES